MKTKKKKPAGQWGGFTTGRGMIVFILPSMLAHSTIAIKICQHHQRYRQRVHAIPCRVLPARHIHAERPDASIFSIAAAFHTQPRRPLRRVFTCTHMCPTGCRYCRWFGGFLRHGIMCALHSIGRLGGVGVACRRGGLSNTALSTTRRRRFPVIKSHACMARGLLVRRLRLMSYAYWAYYKHSRGSMSAFACGNLCFMRCACLQTLLGCMRGMYILFY